MPVRSIFLKIFLCFWLVASLIIAAQISLDWLTRPGSFGGDHLEHSLGPVLTLYGHSAIEYRAMGDDVALARSTDRLRTLTGINAYLVDGTGMAPGGRTLPQDVSNIAGRVMQTGKREFSSSKRRALFALPVKGEDGSAFCVVGDIPLAAFGPPTPLPPPPGPRPPMPPFGPGLFPPPGPTFSLLRLLITLVISGGVCYLLARYLTSPIVKLRDATRRFAGGELTVRIGKGTAKWKDELSELADDFDSMAEHISLLMNQQRQLIRDISHELRSPLARLTIAVELLRRQGGAQAAATLDRIERETIILNEMIGQVLAITRFESDVDTIQMAPVDLLGLLKEIVEDANYEANVRNCTVELLESTACTISGNEEWLRRAVENVVRNAVRYTRANTAVDVRLKRISSDSTVYAEITIEDHGEGVPEKDLPHLFRPFYRVSNARERQTGGSGLGLAITERAVNLHMGSVSASNALEGGLIVVISLPVSD